MKQVFSLAVVLGILTWSSRWSSVSAAISYPNISSSATVITTTNYPDNYPNNAVDDWIVTASSTAWVVLNIIDISMQSGTPCPDITIIGDQTQSWNKSTCSGSFSGTESFLAQNKMYINFTSDASVSARGWMGLLVEAPNQNFYWSTLPTSSCQSSTAIVFLAQSYDSQYFTLPGWPNSYSNSATCKWQITAPTEYVIWVRRLKFVLGAGDSLKIWNGKQSYIFCEDVKWEGNLTAMEEFVSKDDNIFIEFKSDGSGTAEGFYIAFEATPKGDKLTTATTCDGAGITIIVVAAVLSVLVAALVIGLLIWAKKTNRICVPKTHPYFRPDTPVVIKEQSYIRPETPPPPPKAPPRYARANQPIAQRLPAYNF